MIMIDCQLIAAQNKNHTRFAFAYCEHVSEAPFFMNMIYNSKKQATTDQKKPHILSRELGKVY